jgi:hypothetical protein
VLIAVQTPFAYASSAFFSEVLPPQPAPTTASPMATNIERSLRLMTTSFAT